MLVKTNEVDDVQLEQLLTLVRDYTFIGHYRGQTKGLDERGRFFITTLYRDLPWGEFQVRLLKIKIAYVDNSYHATVKTVEGIEVYVNDYDYAKCVMKSILAARLGPEVDLKRVRNFERVKDESTLHCTNL